MKKRIVTIVLLIAIVLLSIALSLVVYKYAKERVKSTELNNNIDNLNSQLEELNTQIETLKSEKEELEKVEEPQVDNQEEASDNTKTVKVYYSADNTLFLTLVEDRDYKKVENAKGDNVRTYFIFEYITRVSMEDSMFGSYYEKDGKLILSPRNVTDVQGENYKNRYGINAYRDSNGSLNLECEFDGEDAIKFGNERLVIK